MEDHGNYIINDMKFWKKHCTNIIATSEKTYTGAWGELAPEMPKRAPKICIEFNAKQIKELFFMQAS